MDAAKAGSPDEQMRLSGMSDQARHIMMWQMRITKLSRYLVWYNDIPLPLADALHASGMPAASMTIVLWPNEACCHGIDHMKLTTSVDHIRAVIRPKVKQQPVECEHQQDTSLCREVGSRV
ncbi:hypothetical protein SMMN14_07542 [Sphaerulina musiva]